LRYRFITYYVGEGFIMERMLLGISPDYLYFHQGKIESVKDVHQPYFLSFPGDQQRVEEIRKQTIKRWQENQDSTSPLSYVSDIGEIEQYQSFWDFKKTWQVFKVFTKESFRVPEVSNHFFFNLGLYTAEHDIPYHQRALIDLLASGKTWLFDSSGKKERLKLLVYDIEIADFQPGRIDLPIDVIGYAEANIDFSSSLDLKTEDFRFDIHNTSEGIDESDVVQLVSNDVDEEVKNLVQFCQLVKEFDIISGHNIAGFDNRQIYGRIQWLLKNKKMMLSGDEKKVFQHFLSKQTRLDKSFHFGMGSDVIQMYPCTFDTYLASRKFYPYLESHSLKAVAPFLDVGVSDRLILKPSEIGTDQRTLRYNAHDVIEKMGVTLHLIQQALPLSFTTGMPFETLLSSGAVSMWDHMALLRGGVQKKIIPAICRVNSICKDLLSHCSGCQSRKDIIKQAKLNRDQLSKEFIRVLKYGGEMPEWMLYPYVVLNEQAKSVDERMNYHMPGGMTIKPDKDAHSDFIPWYKVVVADVGAMYPTILKALNIGADTVRLCPSNEDPDMWVWFKRLPEEFFENVDVKWRKITENEGFADKGFMVGVNINKKPGVVNCAMTGIMSMIQQIKNELHSVQSAGNSEELKRLKMMYQSVKGARNAGSVDYGQRIMLINPDGEYDPRKIGEFVDDAIQKYGSKIEVINGTRFEIAEIADNWCAVSVSKDGETEIKPVTKAVRHKYDGKLVRITTKSGFTIVTPNHSLFTVKNNQLSMIDAGNLDKHTLLVHSEKIPNIQLRQEINLIDEIKSPGYFGYIQKTDLSLFNGYEKKLIEKNVKNNASLPYLKISIEDMKEVQLPKSLLKYVKVGSNGRQASIIPSIIKIDEDMGELLGYYISEGHISKRKINGNSQYYITFSSASKEMHDRIQLLSKNIFDLNVYTLDRLNYAGSYVSTLHAKILKHFFVDLLQCGKNSRLKRIPSCILSSNESVKQSFLNAYMNGDGNIKKSMPPSVPLGRYTTNSRMLNEDLILLKKMQGIKTNTYYRDHDQTYNTRMIQYFKGGRKYFKDCFAIPPKKIEYINSSSEYVYDISVEDNENFVDVNGGIVLHNTHGILAAPNVSGRQFNLWGAGAITTKGQVILDETLKDLEKREIRVVYGDSVDADTDIIIRENGFVKIVKICDLFEKIDSQIMKQNQHEYKKMKDKLECLSVNPEGASEWKKVLFIKRHPFKDKILNVRTQRGNIGITKNHSLYTYLDKLQSISCKDLVENDDKIVHISKFKKQRVHDYKIVNALDPLIPFDESLNIWLNIPQTPESKHLIPYHQPRNNYKGGKGKKKFIRMNIKTAIELYRKNVILNEDLKHSFISSYNGKSKIPVLYKFDEDFARLVGAYASEGSLYFRKRDGNTKEGAHIFVCGHHKKNLANLQKIAERLFKRKFRITDSGMDKNGNNYRIQGTSATAYLFYYVLDCGLKSNGKKVSPFVLSSKESVQKAFMEEFINGDGYYDSRNRINPLLEITSRSKHIIEGVSLLSILLKNGLPSVDYREEKKAYRLRIVQYNKACLDNNEISLLSIKKIK